MKNRSWTALLLAALMLTGCGAQHSLSTQTPAVPAADFMQLEPDGKETDIGFSAAQYRFALELLRNVQKAKGQANVMVSPYSVMQALAMTANGAANQTRAEMEQVLGNGISVNDLNEYLYAWRTNQPDSDSCRLHTANGIWINRDIEQINQLFVTQNQNYYAAEIRKAAFDQKTVKEINGFVNKATGRMIPEILSELDPDAPAVLVNAVSFEGKWAVSYEKEQIRDGVFHNADGSESTVQMLNGEESEYLESEGAVGFLRYYDGPYAFAGILPPEHISVQDWLDAQSSESLLAMIEGRQECAVMSVMPAFTADTDVHLEQILPDMGMPSAFSGSADFSCMSDTPMRISEVIHKTHIEVDAKGTKAAASTAVVMQKNDAEVMPEKTVRLDRPFVYMILDMNTELPVFIGTVQQIP